MQREKIETRLNQLVAHYVQVEEEVSEKVLEDVLEKTREECMAMLNAEFQTIRNEIIEVFRANSSLKQIKGQMEEAKRLARVLLLSAKEDPILAAHFTEKLEVHSNEIGGLTSGIKAKMLPYQPRSYPYHQPASLFSSPNVSSQSWKEELKRHVKVVVRIKGQDIDLTQQNLFFSAAAAPSPFFLQSQPPRLQNNSIFQNTGNQNQRVPQAAGGQQTQRAPQFPQSRPAPTTFGSTRSFAESAQPGYGSNLFGQNPFSGAQTTNQVQGPPVAGQQSLFSAPGTQQNVTSKGTGEGEEKSEQMNIGNI